MKILGVTQGAGLTVYLRLVDMLAREFPTFEGAAYVSDSLAYRSIEPREPRLRDGRLKLLFEWDITSASKHTEPDWDYLREQEQSLGDPVLWNVLLADRRIFFGRSCKFRQDYRPRFDHDQMGAILTVALRQILAFVDDFRPDVVIGFGTATFGDYLLYRIAKVRGIPYLLLKSTKIGNYVSLNDDAVALSAHIKDVLHGRQHLDPITLDEARRHIRSIRERGVRYEGALKSAAKVRFVSGARGLAAGLVRELKTALDPVVRSDNHVDSTLSHAWHANFRQPLSAAFIRYRLKGAILQLKDLETLAGYAFFPLHFEPEVSIQVFGRPFQNQIELVRNLALALPVGMLLVVKEHPRSVGFRPLGYYRKLLDIPNVRLVDPQIPTHVVTRGSSLVAVISGSTGLEAAICGKPVLVFGTPTYNALSDQMICRVSDLHSLGSDIRDLLSRYASDETKLEEFVGAHIQGSVPIDLYSVLLGKQGRVNEGRTTMSEEEKRRTDYDQLSRYVVRRISDVAGSKTSD